MTPHPRLTGPYDTGQLAAISSEPVTVTVARTPKTGCEEELEAGMDELASRAKQAEGGLGAAVLAPGPGDRSYHLVARFEDAVALRAWEQSSERLDVLKALAPCVDEVSVATALSPDAFFEAVADSSVRPKFAKHSIDLLWVLPVALVIALVVAPHFSADPLVLRVLFSSIAGSVVYAALVSPVRRAWRRRRDVAAPLR